MSYIFISEKADKKLIDYLKSENHQVYLMEMVTSLDSAINYHADIFCCQLGNKLWYGDISLLTPKYPGDAIYNGCSTGKYFIHNTKITHPDLLSAAKSTGHTIIHVPQGYARCTILPVNENSIITSDAGTARILEKSGLNVLLIEQGHILLEGFKYGFIGGCGGRVGDTVIFHGNLSNHPDNNRIRQFIADLGFSIKDFSEFPLTDIGSILVED